MFGHYSLSTIAILIISLLVSMVLHEMTHAWVGYKLGDTTAKEAGRISLNPLNHIDPIMTVLLPIVVISLGGPPIMAAKPVPFNPARVKFGEYGSALIAFAGPLSNLVLALIGVLLLHLLMPVGFLGSLLFGFVAVNVSLFIFNLIPIPPLDGSRVLYAFAPEGLQRIMSTIEPYGLFIVFGLVIIGGFNFLGNIISHFYVFLLGLI